MSERALELKGLVARTKSDATLFERALAGDPVAFSEVYRRYHARVYAFCLSRLLDPSLAEDAAQETFVRFLSANPDKVENPRAWLFSVARNVSIDVHRHRARLDDGDRSEDDAFGGVAADTGDEILRREQGRNIMLALRRMRPRYRTALVMRELHGLSSAEMAEALETTPGAVDAAVSRARDAFGRLYAEVCELSGECRSSYPLIYKRLGTGLTPAESSRLDAHLDTCERCQAENDRAATPGRLAGVLPFLAPLGQVKRSGLGQVLASLDPSLLTAPAAVAPVAEHVGLKLAVAGVAVAALVAVPVGQEVRQRAEVRQIRAATTAAAVTSKVEARALAERRAEARAQSSRAEGGQGLTGSAQRVRAKAGASGAGSPAQTSGGGSTGGGDTGSGSGGSGSGTGASGTTRPGSGGAGTGSGSGGAASSSAPNASGAGAGSTSAGGSAATGSGSGSGGTSSGSPASGSGAGTSAQGSPGSGGSGGAGR